MLGDTEPVDKFIWKRDKFMLVYTTLGLLQIAISALLQPHENRHRSEPRVADHDRRHRRSLHGLAGAEEDGAGSRGWQPAAHHGPRRHGDLLRRPASPVLGFLMFIPALVLLSQHLLSAALGISWGLLFYRDILKEERGNATKFGEEYVVYMERVPGLNPVTGILRLLRGRE